jgi:hypothetical protein
MTTRLSLLAFTLAFSAAAWAQPEVPTPPTPPATDSAADGAAGGARGERRARGNFNPDEMRSRMMAGIREQMGVTKDDEWAIISDRITALNDARRSAMGGAMAGFAAMRMGGPGGGPGANGGNGGGRERRGGQGNAEAQALQSALKDNAPDAEIQSRLAKLRDTRKENEAKVAKAQEELRAVLSVRQEAVAVLDGLLP